MRKNKQNIGKKIGMTAVLSATALASAFAASGAPTSTTEHTATRHRGNYVQNQNQSLEQKTAMTTALARVLGTTPETITTQLKAGKTPRDIIKASGLDEATIKAQLEASHEADVHTRGSAGTNLGMLENKSGVHTSKMMIKNSGKK